MFNLFHKTQKLKNLALSIALAFLTTGCYSNANAEDYTFPVNHAQYKDKVGFTSFQEYKNVVTNFFNENKVLYDQKYGSLRSTDINDKYYDVTLNFEKTDVNAFYTSAYFYGKKIYFTDDYKGLLYSYANIFKLPKIDKSQISTTNETVRQTQLDYIALAEKSFEEFQANSFDFSNKKEREIFIDYLMLHELAHLYHFDRGNSAYLSELNWIKYKNFQVGLLRDEFFADMVALLNLKEKYHNSVEVKNVIKKIALSRLILGVDDAISYTDNYNFYYFFKDYSFLDKMSSTDLKAINQKVDELTLKTIQNFGLFDKIKLNDVIEDVFSDSDVLSNQDICSSNYLLDHNHKRYVHCLDYVWLNEQDIEQKHYNYSNSEELKKQLLKSFQQTRLFKQ